MATTPNREPTLADVLEKLENLSTEVDNLSTEVKKIWSKIR